MSNSNILDEQTAPKMELVSESTTTKSVVVDLKQNRSRLVSAQDLLKSEITEMPSLWGKFIPKGELCALIGGSDTGKSTFLRQLAFSVAMKKDEFLGSPLNAKSGNVIYLSTEDGRNAITVSLKKQLGESFDADTLSGLGFLLNVDKPLQAITNELSLRDTDLVIIDCFGDVFSGSINDSVSVRRFFEPYKRLCEKYGCTIVTLHHASKNKEGAMGANKNNVLGSVAFEGANRVVMELRKDGDGHIRKLWFTKANYMSEQDKKNPLVLNFGDDLLFSIAENQESTGGIKGKHKVYPDTLKDAIISAALVCRREGLSIDDTLDALKEMDFEKVPSKGTLHGWLSKLNDIGVQSDNPLGF